MRRIQKRREPECLAKARRDLAQTRRDRRAVDDDPSAYTPSPRDWDTLDTKCKDAMRRALLTEQLGLCAYCMRRLDASHGARDDAPRAGGMRVEHWVARSADPSQTLVWSNVLGVCGGILESPAGVEHTCDKARGERPLALHPAQGEVQALFYYTASGEILSDDPRARDDIDVLNLQARALRARRREVWRAQGDKLRRDDSLGVLRRMLHSARTPDASGCLPPFAAVVEYYAARKLRQRRVKT